MKLLIVNKNYSSWSLRAWLLMSELKIPFEEVKLSFNDPEFKAKVHEHSPAGRVPVLIDGGNAVWESSAIAEHLAERFPSAGVWPSDPAARAMARSVAAEMHAGFHELRDKMPMNIEARLPGLGWNNAVQLDIDRIVQIWTTARERFGKGGDMLFGDFCAADSFYAPVAWRFLTHGVKLPPVAEAYAQAVRSLPTMNAWVEEALTEHDFVEMDEPYRRHP